MASLTPKRVCRHLIAAGEALLREEKYDFPEGLAFPKNLFDASNKDHYSFDPDDPDNAHLLHYLMQGEHAYLDMVIEYLEGVHMQMIDSMRIDPPGFRAQKEKKKQRKRGQRAPTAAASTPTTAATAAPVDPGSATAEPFIAAAEPEIDFAEPGAEFAEPAAQRAPELSAAAFEELINPTDGFGDDPLKMRAALQDQVAQFDPDVQATIQRLSRMFENEENAATNAVPEMMDVADTDNAAPNVNGTPAPVANVVIPAPNLVAQVPNIAGPASPENAAQQQPRQIRHRRRTTKNRRDQDEVLSIFNNQASSSVGDAPGVTLADWANIVEGVKPSTADPRITSTPMPVYANLPPPPERQQLTVSDIPAVDFDDDILAMIGNDIPEPMGESASVPTESAVVSGMETTTNPTAAASTEDQELQQAASINDQRSTPMQGAASNAEENAFVPRPRKAWATLMQQFNFPRKPTKTRTRQPTARVPRPAPNMASNVPPQPAHPRVANRDPMTFEHMRILRLLFAYSEVDIEDYLQVYETPEERLRAMTAVTTAATEGILEIILRNDEIVGFRTADREPADESSEESSVEELDEEEVETEGSSEDFSESVPTEDFSDSDYQ